MRFQEIRALPGPNIYTHRSALCAILDLQEWSTRESHQLPGFVERLLQILPSLGEHHCGLGYPGGFVQRLQEGTLLGHVIEHAALELQALSGFRVTHGKTRGTSDPQVFRIVIEYENEASARHCLESAQQLVWTCIHGEDFDLTSCLQKAQALAEQTELGPSTMAIADAAQRRGIPVIRLDKGSLIQLGYGCHRRLVAATETQFTSSVSVDIAGDKAATKEMLSNVDIPTPRGSVVETLDEALAQLAVLSPPLVVKPLDGNQGRGVSLGLSTAAEVRRAFERAAAISHRVVIEELFTGSDYRVLVVQGRMVAASKRIPAHVVGDGVHTIAELIEIENRNPMRGDGHSRPLTFLPNDCVTQELLRQHGWSLDDIPAYGERVMLRETANLSTGGTARDVTDDAHPDVRRMCERAARVIGLDVCGIDLMTADISRPLPAKGAGIIEVNAAPGIRMHHFPSEGKPRDVAGAIVDMLYPPSAPSRIPTLAVTGTNGKTTVARMIAGIISAGGKTVGLTTTDGIYIGGHCVTRGDMTGFRSCRMVLSDPAVEVAILETARGGIVRRSLGYDWTDVGIITNVQPDHLGQDGIETLDDLVHVKSLIAERVREGGTIILNADDPNLACLPERPLIGAERKQITFFSLRSDNPVIRKHLSTGGSAYWASEGWLIEGNGPRSRRVVPEAAVPATFAGTARFQVLNALAAIAGARAMGASFECIASSLSEFHGGLHNPGRMNLFQVGDGYILLDYGHNPSAFDAVAQLTKHWSPRRVTAVLTVPGDRSDAIVIDSGRVIARSFDRLIIREDHDTRGRQHGEIARLLCSAIHEVNADADCRTVLDECEAVRVALQEIEADEAIIIFHDSYDQVLEVLNEFGAQPIPADSLMNRSMLTMSKPFVVSPKRTSAPSCHPSFAR